MEALGFGDAIERVVKRVWIKDMNCDVGIAGYFFIEIAKSKLPAVVTSKVCKEGCSE